MSVQLYNPTTDELTQVAGEEFNDTVIRVSALPSASADLINETYLLVADQTGYARGGIYQCQYVNDAFTWVLVNGSGMTVDAVEDGNMNGVTSNAVADKFATLGTASEKDFTNYVSPTDSGLPISSSVFSAITNALYGAYHPSGSKTIAELDSSLLIQANVGNVYKITDSGVTTDLFIGGAGQTINIGDDAVVVYDTSGETFKYALQSGAVDLSSYQEKELPSGAMIEDVIPTDASASNKLVTSNTLNGFDIRGNSGGEAQQYANSWMEVAKVETVAGTYARNSVIFLFMPIYGGSTKFGMVFVDITKSSSASELLSKTIAVSGGLEATDFGADIEWNGNVPTLTLRCKAPKNYAYYNIKVLSYSNVKPTLVNTVLNPTVAPTSIAPSEVVKV